jgi:DNA repair protein RadC
MILLQDSKIKIGEATDVARIFQDLLTLKDSIDQEKEHYFVMHLDARQRINMVELVAVGILTHATIHPRETYRRAVAQGSASIIIAHNHPSGEVDPSTDDLLATKKIQEAGEILGIPLLDHVIFTETGFYSFTRGARGGDSKQ